jgi:hypothetical protein
MTRAHSDGPLLRLQYGVAFPRVCASVLALDGPHSRANGHGYRASAQSVGVLELV